MKSTNKIVKALLGGGAILLLVLTFVSQAAAQTWTELLPSGGVPPDAPEARSGHSAVYDLNTNRMIMFGGVPYHETGTPTLYNDVWVLSNADGASTPTWAQLSPGGGPSARGFHSAVYDPNTNRMIVFGGDPDIGNCLHRTNDVWVLEGANGLGGTPPNWLQLFPTGGPPSVRGLHSAVYDPATNRMIVFGGNNACEDARNDVWVLEDANGYGTPNWIELTPSNAPILPGGGSSGGHSAVYEANNRMIVFIGVWCCANDVYVLENANGLGGTPTWIQLSPIGTPPSARAGQTAVYDPGSNQMILFGGLVGNFANDVWVLEDANGDGTPEWIELSPAGGPPVVRESHTAIYNPAANRMTVFGGRTSGASLNDVWVLSFDESDGEGPIVTNLVAVPNPVLVDTDFEIIATINDSTTGGSNIASAEYSVDGGTWSSMAATDGAFNGPIEDVNVLFSFDIPGVYDICVRGTDEWGYLGPEECLLLAVYDPDGGFVTGGGWFDSPAGAYTPEPLLTGKANFGFVSKYKKGAEIPTGNTEFQFKVADLNFHSDQYDWLVVAGSTAKFKGLGTINGSGAYKFMVWAKDSSPDTFRIKIWEEEDDGGEETVIYDNQLGDDEYSDPTTEIGGGNIVVHKAKK